MKKFMAFILAFFFIVFFMPILLTSTKCKTNLSLNKNEVQNEVELNNETAKIQEYEKKEYEKYDYKKYGTIRLLHEKTGEIKELPIDEYLLGVVSSEMPASFEIEALKAQAVVARTYTIYQIMHSNGKHGEADICDNFACCQAWMSKEDRLNKWNENERENNWNKITDAVNSTSGKIITYDGEPIDAFFHSNSGGVTETAGNVWGGKNLPYLQCVEVSGENNYEQFSSEVKLSKEELLNKLKVKYPEVEINFNEQDQINIEEYTESGRVKTIKFGNIRLAGTEVRSILGLKSTNFKIEIDDSNIIFLVYGYGHGVGMSQTGANSLAKQGKNYEEIIKHFYTGIEIVDEGY